MESSLSSIYILEGEEESSKVSCPANELYNCGTTCVETCDYKPTICQKNCRFGCFCQKGYVRRSNATDSPCIPSEDCKDTRVTPKCCRNQEYLTCGSACPATCEAFSYPLPKPPKACIDLCVAGCFCKTGYYRSERNKCVTPERCCNGENERYNACGTACPETCDSTPRVCTKQCVRGCFCASSDFVRKDNSTGSPCIPRRECPS